MNAFTVTVHRFLASALAGAALLTFGPGLLRAQIMLRVPGESPGAPLYTRTDPPFTFHTEQWAAVAFYREPDCVPSDVNLLQFPIPAAYACPLTVSGFEIWENPGIDAAPRQAFSSGSAVPVWFVPWAVFQAVIADDVLTKSELESLTPLKGTATTYLEILHPFAPPGATGGAKVPHLSITAAGFLPDGRSFQYEFTSVEYGKAKHVRIAIR